MKPNDAKSRGTLPRVLCLLALVGVTALCIFVYLRYGKALWSLVTDADRFRAWIDRFGAWSGAVFVAVRSLQTVVKIVPAEPLEIGSGLLFGAVGGMLLCLLGNIIGSLVILFLTRKLGTRVLELFRLENKLRSMRFLQDREKRIALLFLFYLIPGTPKDGMTYFVGLTDVNLTEYMILTSIARIPSILSSTICGAFLGRRNIPLAIGVFAATAVLSLLGGYAYKKISSRYAMRRETSEQPDITGEKPDDTDPA